MKRIVCTLLMAIAMTTGFAQTTPDYVQKAKAGLTQYYPQFKDYFEPIFAEYNKLSINARNIVNNKIKENFEIFDGELTTERDKCATILTAMDDMIGNKTFRNSKKQIDSEVGEKGINSIAEEVTGDINYQIRKEIQKNNERIVNLEARNTKLREILNVIDLYNNKKESADIIFENIEDFFALFDISEIKENKGLQKVINKYIDLNKQINRRPSAIGQKFIDEYNRIKH